MVPKIPVPLDIDAALTDTDGSENLAILIEDAGGSSLSAPGTDSGDGTWSLQSEERTGLEFILQVISMVMWY
ncbi:hypothetical protein O9993_21585 [Vibrio lentus]|nr:hypothetical protein [Vibrio lentus]